MHRRYTIVDGVAVPIISGGDGSTEPDDIVLPGDGEEPNASGADPLVADPEHGGVTDDLLEQAIQRSQWGKPNAPAPGNGATDDEPPAPQAAGDETGGDTGEAAAEGDVEGVTPPPAAEETPPAPNLDEVIEVVPGVNMTRRDAARWASFQAEIEANPEFAQRVAAGLRGAYGLDGAPPAQPGTPPAPAAPPADETPAVPEGLDLEDPSVAALWQQHLDQQAVNAQLMERLTHLDEFVTNAQMQTTESLIGTARQNYQQKHNLSDTEMQQVYDLTAELQVLPALMSTTDPTTGMPRQVDPLVAMDRAFDIARHSIPELRQREIDAQLEAAKHDTKRKRKLSSLSGSSGSTPRTPPIPTDAKGRREAMVAEVASWMSGQGAPE